MDTKECSKDCKKCKHLNTRTDNKSYPFAYECMIYNEAVEVKDFGNTKAFNKRK